MKEIIKIVLSNWINVVVIFILVYFVKCISFLKDGRFTFRESLETPLYHIFGYGFLFWLIFLFLISVSDLLLFGFSRELKYTGYKLLLQWLIVSLPFIYWIVRDNARIFLVAMLAFLLGQYLRRGYILNILK